MGFRRLDTELHGLCVIEPDIFRDSRGFFSELYNQEAFRQLGLNGLDFVQDNFSSSSKGTIRGLHFQAPPFAQAKLITVLQGSVLDVAVDIRRSSPTYGKAYAIELDASDMRMLLVPEGFAHGFQVLSESCLFFYKCSRMYHRESEGGIRWDDPDIGIPWHDIPHIISQKDSSNPLLKDFRSPFD
jgi:dTDP-4-dehydrorhamnose 3,5-epimerase